MQNLNLFALVPLHQAVTEHGFLCCRNAFGNEPPEVAQQFLTQGWYRPRPSQDMYAVGQTILEMAGGYRPQEHLVHLHDPRFPAERASGVRDIAQLPGHAAYYGYLKGLTDQNAAYEKQVRLHIH